MVRWKEKKKVDRESALVVVGEKKEGGKGEREDKKESRKRRAKAEISNSLTFRKKNAAEKNSAASLPSN